MRIRAIGGGLGVLVLAAVALTLCSSDAEDRARDTNSRAAHADHAELPASRSETRIDVAARGHVASTDSDVATASAERSADEIVAALRSARASADRSRIDAELKALSSIADASISDLARLLRAEVLAPGEPEVTFDLCSAITRCAVVRAQPWIDALGAESLDLRGDVADAAFTRRVASFHWVLRNAKPARTDSMAAFALAVTRNEPDLTVHRRALFGTLAALDRAEFVPTLRDLVLDESEELETRMSAARALIRLDAAAGLASLSVLLDAASDPTQRQAIARLAAESSDYASGLALFRDVVADTDPMAGPLVMMFAMRMATHHAERDARGVANFLVDEAIDELDGSPYVAANLIQALGLGTTSSRTLGDHIAEDVELRGRLKGLADGEGARGSAARGSTAQGEFVAGAAAGTWAATATSVEEYFAALDEWKRTSPASYRGALMRGASMLRRMTDDVAKQEARRRLEVRLREILTTSRDERELEAALSACLSGYFIELIPEVQPFANGESEVAQVRAHATRVLERLERKAAEK